MRGETKASSPVTCPLPWGAPSPLEVATEHHNTLRSSSLGNAQVLEPPAPYPDRSRLRGGARQQPPRPQSRAESRARCRGRHRVRRCALPCAQPRNPARARPSAPRRSGLGPGSPIPGFRDLRPREEDVHRGSRAAVSHRWVQDVELGKEKVQSAGESCGTSRGGRYPPVPSPRTTVPGGDG